MSKFITWKKLKDTDGICNTGLGEVIEQLGGKGITLPQARKACKEGVFSLPDAVRAATAIKLPNWKLALGKVVAFVHPKAKKYYKHKDAYLHNQNVLESGRIEDVDGAAADAAWAAAEAAGKEDAAAFADNATDEATGEEDAADRAAAWAADAVEAAARAAAWAADAAHAARDADAVDVDLAADAAAWATRADRTNVNNLIDIYFNVLEEK
jgi:hypothetical protein